MKTTGYAAIQPSLTVEPFEFDVPEPKSHEVLIKIAYCSIGRGDVSFLRNDYKISDLRYPLVAGHEMVGIIETLGVNIRGFSVGDRVGVGYQVWSCGECTYCKTGNENLCQKQECLVMNRPGGFARHITVDERFVFKIPESLESAEATPLLCSGLTVYSAIEKANVDETMAVGVVGVGGLGHFSVQLLHVLGADVTAFTSKKDSITIEKLGADHVVPYESKDTELQSFDRLFVTTHAHIDYDYYLSLLKPDGELWVVGVDTQKTTLSSWLLNDLASRSIRGSYIGSPTEMRKLLDLASRADIVGKIKVVPARQLNRALEMVANGSGEFRIVVDMGVS